MAVSPPPPPPPSGLADCRLEIRAKNPTRSEGAQWRSARDVWVNFTNGERVEHLKI